MDKPISERSIIVNHTGRETVATVVADDDQYEAFRRALLDDEFYVTRTGESELRLRRNVRVMRGDWPISLSIKRDESQLEIRYYMFVPWSWLIPFCVLVFFVLPFISFQGTPFAFLVALGVIAFALYKRRFDIRPDASWQGPPREKWNEKINGLLTRIFDAEIQESK